MPMATITIEVTQEDIDKGEPGEACRCPIARAVSRLTPPGTLVVVDGKGIEFQDLETEVGFAGALLPYAAEIFAVRFDRCEPVSPFSFALDIPDGLLSPAPATP
jgi:hypothetical protein